MGQNRNLFRLNRFILFKLPKLVALFAGFRKAQKRVLIIKTDAIGDYILFRNFIEVVKTSAAYKDHQVDLLGNSLWKDIALQYDAPFVDRFFFTRADDLYYQPWQTLKLAWQLFRRNYSIVLQPTYSRTLIADGLANWCMADELIGFESDTERILPKYKGKTDKFYTRLLSLPSIVNFEFDRSKYFFESILGQNIALNGPSIAVKDPVKKDILIFPGAGVVKRSWSGDQFLQLIRLIRQNTQATIYLAGGPSEVAIGDFLQQNSEPGSVVNLINKTSLPQLIEQIANAALIISNETSAIHIAAATQTNCVCILGGGHFERFAPYPDYIINKPVCVYEKMPCFYCNWNCIYTTAPNEAYPCIANVSVEAVWQVTRQLLPITGIN
jgi:ADP-heptose:LPS heptosyltransferase